VFQTCTPFTPDTSPRSSCAAHLTPHRHRPGTTASFPFTPTKYLGLLHSVELRLEGDGVGRVELAGIVVKQVLPAYLF
jgi:hypothetical protein